MMASEEPNLSIDLLTQQAATKIEAMVAESGITASTFRAIYHTAQTLVGLELVEEGSQKETLAKLDYYVNFITKSLPESLLLDDPQAVTGSESPNYIYDFLSHKLVNQISDEQRKPIALDDINAMDRIGPMLFEIAKFLSPNLISKLAKASYSTPTISSDDQYFQVGVAAYLPEALEPAANLDLQKWTQDDFGWLKRYLLTLSQPSLGESLDVAVYDIQNEEELLTFLQQLPPGSADSQSPLEIYEYWHQQRIQFAADLSITPEELSWREVATMAQLSATEYFGKYKGKDYEAQLLSFHEHYQSCLSNEINWREDDAPILNSARPDSFSDWIEHVQAFDDFCNHPSKDHPIINLNNFKGVLLKNLTQVLTEHQSGLDEMQSIRIEAMRDDLLNQGTLPTVDTFQAAMDTETLDMVSERTTSREKWRAFKPSQPSTNSKLVSKIQANTLLQTTCDLLKLHQAEVPPPRSNIKFS